MKKLFLLILAGGIMMTACKKDENVKNENKNYYFRGESITIKKPKFKLIDSNYIENGNRGKLYVDENNPKITYFQIEQSTKQLLYKGHWHSGYQGNNYYATCSECNNCEIDCRVDAVTNEKGDIVAIKITRIIKD